MNTRIKELEDALTRERFNAEGWRRNCEFWRRDFEAARETLRDRFASAALQGILAGSGNARVAELVGDGVLSDLGGEVRTAFDYADEMMAERARRIGAAAQTPKEAP